MVLVLRDIFRFHVSLLRCFSPFIVRSAFCVELQERNFKNFLCVFYIQIWFFLSSEKLRKKLRWNWNWLAAIFKLMKWINKFMAVSFMMWFNYCSRIQWQILVDWFKKAKKRWWGECRNVKSKSNRRQDVLYWVYWRFIAFLCLLLCEFYSFFIVIFLFLLQFNET